MSGVTSLCCMCVSMSDRAITDRAVSRCVAAMCCRVLCPALCVCVYTLHSPSLSLSSAWVIIGRSTARTMLRRDAVGGCTVASLTAHGDVTSPLWRGIDCRPHAITDATVCAADEMPLPIIGHELQPCDVSTAMWHRCECVYPRVRCRVVCVSVAVMPVCPRLSSRGHYDFASLL
jgi:hypothetical protein